MTLPTHYRPSALPQAHPHLTALTMSSIHPPFFSLLPLVLLHVLVLLPLAHAILPQCASPPPPGVPPSRKFCRFPPTVPLSLPLYQGRWFNTFNSGIARRFSTGACVTANYTLLPNGTVAVLNCNQLDRSMPPGCVRASAVRRPGTNSTGKLLVSFPSSPMGFGNPGPYNVVALLGDERIGYFAAAVYSCEVVEGIGPVDGLFILSRVNVLKKLVFHLLAIKLKCAGFDLSQEFVEVDHTGCQYFDEAGFVERPAGGSMPPVMGSRQ